MSRNPKASVAAERTLAVRMTDNDHTLLGRLVLLRRDELAELGADEADVTAASYIRALLRREAKAKGITATPAAPDASAPQAAPAPVADAPPETSAPQAAPAPVAEDAPVPKAPAEPTAAPDMP